MGTILIFPFAPVRYVIHCRICSPTLIDCTTPGPKTPGAPLIGENQLPSLVISGAIALIYLADRTGFWLKEHKQFDLWTFAFLNIFCLFIGLLTVKRADKDLGFLNREQTDEWKGWMQRGSTPRFTRAALTGSPFNSRDSQLPLFRCLQGVWHL